MGVQAVRQYAWVGLLLVSSQGSRKALCTNRKLGVLCNLSLWVGGFPGTAEPPKLVRLAYPLFQNSDGEPSDPQSLHERERTLLGAQVLEVHSLGFFGRRGVQSSTVHAGVVGARTAERARERIVSNTGALHSECLVHDGAAPGKHLQVRHAAGAG